MKPLPQSFPNPVKVEEVRTRADYLAEARVRQAGAGFSSPLLTVSEEQLARADADIGSWELRSRGRKCAPGFRLTPYGLEKI